MARSRLELRKGIQQLEKDLGRKFERETCHWIRDSIELALDEDFIMFEFF
jgi:hypothetical protein